MMALGLLSRISRDSAKVNNIKDCNSKSLKNHEIPPCSQQEWQAMISSGWKRMLINYGVMIGLNYFTVPNFINLYFFNRNFSKKVQ